jgi:hypothetical protein
MEEINQLKERIEFLELKYKELVDDYVQFKCRCNKPFQFHKGTPAEEIKEELLKRIDD